MKHAIVPLCMSLAMGFGPHCRWISPSLALREYDLLEMPQEAARKHRHQHAERSPEVAIAADLRAGRVSCEALGNPAHMLDRLQARWLT